jgi:hypothetical protein
MTIIRHRSLHPIRPQAASHLFAVGQTVRLRSSFGTFPKSAEIYHITATLPPSGDTPQYRIRNDEERHERVAMQDNIQAIDVSAEDGRTLIERTFGHGQGTETQQPRDQEAEAEEGTAQA